MGNTFALLKNICHKYLLREKIIIMPSHAAGRRKAKRNQV